MQEICSFSSLEPKNTTSLINICPKSFVVGASETFHVFYSEITEARGEYPQLNLSATGVVDLFIKVIYRAYMKNNGK